jgi:hypothetical protein
VKRFPGMLTVPEDGDCVRNARNASHVLADNSYVTAGLSRSVNVALTCGSCAQLTVSHRSSVEELAKLLAITDDDFRMYDVVFRMFMM